MHEYLQSIKRIANQTLKKISAQPIVDYYSHIPQSVSAILAQSESPEPLDHTGAFDSLQDRPAPALQYGYDSFSCWRRGVERAATVIEHTHMFEPGASTLEIGCGDGMVSAALSGFGHIATLLDMDDWRDTRARALTFSAHNIASPLPFENATFDLAFSYNSFEHIPDPEFALSEMVRVLRPGGYVFLDFDPLYASAWGLHAWRSLRMPYPQFLFSDDFIETKIRELGLYDLGKKLTSLQPLNRWRVDQFRDLWKRSGCQVVSLLEMKNTSELAIVEKFPESFRGRGLVLDDLVVHGIRVVLRRSAQL